MVEYLAGNFSELFDRHVLVNVNENPYPDARILIALPAITVMVTNDITA